MSSAHTPERLLSASRATREAGSAKLVLSNMFGQPSPSDADLVGRGVADLAKMRSWVNRRVLSERMASERLATHQGLGGTLFTGALAADTEMAFSLGRKFVRSPSGEWSLVESSVTPWRDLEDPLWWLDRFPEWASQVSEDPDQGAGVTFSCELDLRVATGDTRGLAWHDRRKRFGFGRRITDWVTALPAHVTLDREGRVTRFAHGYPTPHETDETPFWKIIDLSEFGTPLSEAPTALS